MALPETPRALNVAVGFPVSGLILLGERRNPGLDPLELVGEPGEEIAELVLVEHVESDGEALAA